MKPAPATLAPATIIHDSYGGPDRLHLEAPTMRELHEKLAAFRALFGEPSGIIARAHHFVLKDKPTWHKDSPLGYGRGYTVTEIGAKYLTIEVDKKRVAIDRARCERFEIEIIIKRSER